MQIQLEALLWLSTETLLIHASGGSAGEDMF